MLDHEVAQTASPAVKSLRSKFEQMALVQGAGGTPRIPIRESSDLLSVRQPSPRPRALSSTDSDIPDAVQSLRTSSSSSDLKVSIKRPPPPPPPPRGSKLQAPCSPSLPCSPLLRPAPAIPINPTALNATTSLPTSSSTVLALKSRFDSTPPTTIRVPNPRQSISNAYPAFPRESTSLPTKPPVPPRPLSSNFISQNFVRSLEDDEPEPVTSSPRDLEDLEVEDDSVSESESSPDNVQPPAIPPRRIPDAHVKNLHDFDDTSQMSSDSDTSQLSTLIPALPPRSSRLSTIPPPPRHRASVSPNGGDRSLVSSYSAKSTTTTPPPPLPLRRSTIAQPTESAAQIHRSHPPRLPGRPYLAPPIPGNGLIHETPLSSPVVERRPVGTNRLPPPPTRNIAPGDRLPLPRRPASPSSDSESGGEEEMQRVDLMPDSSSSSRRPPLLLFRDGYPEPRIHFHPHSGSVVASGPYVVVAHTHHLKIYNLLLSDVPIISLEMKDVGLKDSKITCMEFRPSAVKADRGFLIWITTKEGHIVEMDIRKGTLNATKHAAHLYPITHIFRYGRSMVTLDDSGKVLVFSPDPEKWEDINLATTQPRVVRTTEKQDFVKLLDGKLWTAARTEHHGGATNKLPIIRVYDIFNPATTGRSLLPLEHVGSLTSATIIPVHPDLVYIGHEEGYVSIWALETEDGWPKCTEVTKVSMSDVLSLEGVSDRLWAGSRNGMISAYDVTQKPWIVTNCWNAHPGLPVMKIFVNYYAIPMTNRLCVVSLGRDEQLRLWDGLLGVDWVDKELLKNENSFSTFRELTALIVSWNCDSARPDSLNEDPINYEFLNEVLHSVESPDIISFGFQEVIDLESRKMVAKNVILGGKKKTDDALSDKVTGAYKRWYERLVIAVKTAMPRGVEYTVIHTESLIGLFSCIFVKSSERASFNDITVTTIKRGMGGRYGNKGGIVARFVVADSSLCFINCHLAAGQNAVRQRNADVAGMLEDKAVFSPSEHRLAYVGGGDGTMVLDHEFVLFNGDMNYRIDHRRDAIVAAIRAGDFAALFPHDQLLREIKFNRGCRWRGFSEGQLTFAPTYKYDPRSNEYDSSEKHRSPAWCDRVLWRARVPSRVRQLHYRRYEANVSDHRPISAAFVITVKSIQPEARERSKSIVEAAWIEAQSHLLDDVQNFYVGQALL